MRVTVDSSPRHGVVRRVIPFVVLTVIIAGIYVAAIAWHRAEIESLSRRRDWLGVVATARRLLLIHPDDGVATRLAARASIRLGRPLEALEFLRRAGGLDLEDLHLLGAGLLREGRVAEAGEVYRRILETSPNDTLALKRAAAIDLADQRWDRAESLAKRLIELPKGRIAGHTLAGSIYYHLGRKGIVGMFGMALGEFEQVLAADPELREMPLPQGLFWNQYASILIEEGRNEQARAAIERRLSQAGDDPGLLTRLGELLESAGDAEGAADAWRRALAIDPGRSETELALGRSALRRGDLAEAEARIRRAVDAEPDSIEALYAWSNLLQRLGRRGEADAARTRVERLRRPAAPGAPPADDG
ncbi:MAG: tetratricopeptide repeat protein [Isosphaeraceae bacterium]|nr:tetratricopeptide repeat protein [Isosphaeraceae bacterium]